MQEAQKNGFGVVGIISIIAAVAILGGGYWYWQSRIEVSLPPSSDQSPVVAESDFTGWKTYRNEKYGFEVRYPQNWIDDPSVITLLDIKQGELDVIVGDQKFRIVYKPEEARCSQGIGCFYPGQFSAAIISKMELQPVGRSPIRPFSEYIKAYADLWLKPGADIKIQELQIGDHPAAKITPFLWKEGPDAVFVPDITMLIEYSDREVILIEGRAFDEYREEIVPVIDKILSTFKFIPSKNSGQVK